MSGGDGEERRRRRWGVRSVVDIGLGETVREIETLRVDHGVKEVGRMELGFRSSALFF